MRLSSAPNNLAAKEGSSRELPSKPAKLISHPGRHAPTRNRAASALRVLSSIERFAAPMKRCFAASRWIKCACALLIPEALKRWECCLPVSAIAFAPTPRVEIIERLTDSAARWGTKSVHPKTRVPGQLATRFGQSQGYHAPRLDSRKHGHGHFFGRYVFASGFLLARPRRAASRSNGWP